VKLDKETIIALAVCMVLLIVWPFLFSEPKKPQLPASAQSQEMKTASGESSFSAIPAEKPLKKTEESATAEKKNDEKSPVKKNVERETEAEPADLPKLPDQIISNDFIALRISPLSGAVTSIELKKYLSTDKKHPIVIDEDFKPGALSFTISEKLKTVNAEFSKESENTLKVTRTFKNEADQSFAVTQIWKISDSYTTDYKVEVKNLSKEKLILSGIHISSGSIPPVMELSGDAFFMDTHSISSCLEGTVKRTDAEKKPFKEPHQDNSAKWIGVSNKYFACILKPGSPFKKGEGNMMNQIFKTVKDEKTGVETSYAVLETYGIIEKAEIDGNGKADFNFTYFSGPKEISLLKNFDPQAPDLMYLCVNYMKWFEPISQGLLLALIWLKTFCGSYGLSIIVLTLIVKLLFWPITDRANASMRKMQKIQPLVQEIRTKYKAEPQKMNTKIMQLYKDHKVNPMGGCLPILLQIPVFTALYFALNGAIELRQASFLWAVDLSRPDTIAVIPGIELGINPLVLLMTITMVIQQYLTPSAADPVQQKMMMILPLVMLVMLYSLPSGLTLYWTVSQIISIVQLLVNKRIDKNEPLVKKPA
jgi:YidC/Oxa1 family membrane protein insertase